MLLIVLVSMVMGIAPMLAYALFIWWLDRWEKEPLPLLGAAFVWGFLPSALIALISQLILDVPTAIIFGQHSLGYELFSGSIIAPVTEEVIKGFAVLMIFVFFYREFDSALDGIVYGSLAGFGFAAIENILYFISYGSEDASSLGCLIFLRAFAFGLNHAFFTSLTGIGFAWARYQRNLLLKLLLPVLGLGAAIFAHGIHNAFATFGLFGLPFAFIADWMGIVGVAVVALISLYHEAGWIKHYLIEEVENGVLTRNQAATAASFGGRIAAETTAFFKGPSLWWRTRQFYQRCAELAYKKHQLKRMGDEGGNSSLIQSLRNTIQSNSPQI